MRAISKMSIVDSAEAGQFAGNCPAQAVEKAFGSFDSLK